MSLKSSNKTDTNVYTLEIEIGAEPFKAAVLKAYNKAKSKIALPGFRKGKAPLAMIERFYGKDVFYEDALEIAFPEAVSDAYKEAGIEPVDSPKDVNVKSIGEDGVLFEMKVTVKPEDIKVKAYKGLEAEKAEAAVTPEEVDARIEAMRERNARTITVEDRAAANGDIAVIDFEGFVDGKAFEGGKGSNYELELGSGQFIPGFEDQVIGHNAGESFDVNVKFPEEYTPELAGKDATFKVTLHEIKVKELPELDDEFAKDLDYDTSTSSRRASRLICLSTDSPMSRRSSRQSSWKSLLPMSRLRFPRSCSTPRRRRTSTTSLRDSLSRASMLTPIFHTWAPTRKLSRAPCASRLFLRSSSVLLSTR